MPDAAVIRIHEVNVTQAYSIYETGRFYALGHVGIRDPAGYYDGSCTPTDRVLELAAGVEVSENKAGGVTFRLGGTLLLDSELLDCGGRITDRRFGTTRHAKPGEAIIEDAYEAYVKTELFYLIDDVGYVLDEAKAHDQAEAEDMFSGNVHYGYGSAKVVRAADHDAETELDL